jgi:hypothetical protein
MLHPMLEQQGMVASQLLPYSMQEGVGLVVALLPPLPLCRLPEPVLVPAQEQAS